MTVIREYFLSFILINDQNMKKIYVNIEKNDNMTKYEHYKYYHPYDFHILYVSIIMNMKLIIYILKELNFELLT